MLKLAGLTVAALGLATVGAFAQSPPADASPLPPAPPEINRDNPPPPPEPRGPERAEGKDEWRMHPRGDRPPPPPEKAAHFRVRIGDARINVKCAEDEPMKACADLLLQIIDRANASSDERDPDRNYGRDRNRFERYDRR